MRTSLSELEVQLASIRNGFTKNRISPTQKFNPPIFQAPYAGYTDFLGSMPGKPWIQIVPSFSGITQQVKWDLLTIRIGVLYSKTCKELDTTVRYWEREIMG